MSPTLREEKRKGLKQWPRGDHLLVDPSPRLLLQGPPLKMDPVRRGSLSPGSLNLPSTLHHLILNRTHQTQKWNMSLRKRRRRNRKMIRK
jgi:hypothetical protein